MQKKSKKVNKVVYIGCTVGVLAASVSILCGAAAGTKANKRLDKSDFLKTDGRLIKNARGETVILRGVNLGGWLVQESWMCPSSGENNLWGYNDTLAVLAERFGDKIANELISTYLNNWITTADLDYLKNLGVNCVRVPFSYRNFQSDDNGTWMRNKNGGIDFSRLDWIVAECGKRGIYVIPVMHGAPGFQSNDHSCGKANASELFDCSLAGLKYRQRTAELWQELARHFKGNPAVAAFDLLNEPMNGYPEKDTSDCRLRHLYNKLCEAVRAADPNRMITVQGGRETENLPNPKLFCRHNVVYQLHVYNWTAPEIDRRISAIHDRAKCNMPVFIGEFQAGGLWDPTMSTFNVSSLSWCAWTYKGVKTQKSDRFLFAAEIEAANLQEDSFEEIKAKWGKPCRTAESFTQNTELAAALKKYLTGVAQTIEDIPAFPEPAVTVEVYDVTEDIPNTGEKKSADPVKFIYGTATLVGMGTLEELTKKKDE